MSENGENMVLHHPPHRPVVPGRCDPIVGCPPPTEIVCIKVDKVYEECKRTITENVGPILVTGASGSLVDVECVSAEVVEGDPYIPDPVCEILSNNRVRTIFTVRVTAHWTDSMGNSGTVSETIEQEVTTRLSRAGEPGLEPECDIFVQCLECFAGPNQNSTPTIICCIGKLVLFKLIARVQLMIPAYGFCPEPEECEVAGECPEFTPVWPPYPPQLR